MPYEKKFFQVKILNNFHCLSSDGRKQSLTLMIVPLIYRFLLGISMLEVRTGGQVILLILRVGRLGIWLLNIIFIKLSMGLRTFFPTLLLALILFLHRRRVLFRTQVFFLPYFLDAIINWFSQR